MKWGIVGANERELRREEQGESDKEGERKSKNWTNEASFFFQQNVIEILFYNKP